MPLSPKCNLCVSNCQLEKWQSKPKTGCAGIWCSTEKKHNKVQITQPNFPRNCRGMEICKWAGNAQSCPILTKHWFVRHCCICLLDFCFSSTNKKPHKTAQNSWGLMCLNPGCSQAVHPVGKSHAAYEWLFYSWLWDPCIHLTSFLFPYSSSGHILLPGCHNELLNKISGREKKW